MLKIRIVSVRMETSKSCTRCCFVTVLQLIAINVPFFVVFPRQDQATLYLPHCRSSSHKFLVHQTPSRTNKVAT